MKHIKLFEDFKVKYNLIKDFPPTGCCQCSDIEESDALCEMLEDAKYVNANQETRNQTNEWKSARLTIVWNDNRKYFRMSENSSQFENNYRLIEFDDYFEVEEKYKGHQTGKKYGI